MTSILLFFAAIAACIGVARYFESNRWFWSTFTAFLLAFSICVLANSGDNKKESKKALTEQVMPTQGLPATLGSLIYLVADDSPSATKKVTSKPVGQANTPAFCKRTLTSSDVPGVTEGLYFHMLPNPPNSVEIVSDA